MFKRYLWCIALALSLSGSAYAAKGGSLGTRTLQQKLVNSKLGRTVAVGLLGITITCGGITGCGKGNNPVTPTETEVVEVTEVTETVQVVTHYDGDSIYFELGGTTYEGRVVEGVSADEVLVTLADGSDMVINVDRIGGTLIADHPDLGTRVVLLSKQEGESTLSGDIVKVYGDMRKIEITRVTFKDGTIEVLDVPRVRFVAEDTDFEEGGYLTLEEFAKWLNWQ